MARYTVSIRTPLRPEAAFDYMADLRHFADWDPGVKKVEQITGSGGGANTSFDVTVASIGRPLVLRYETKMFDAPREVLVEAASRLFTSTDRITVAAEPDGGATVTYDAELRFNGVLGAADLLLKPVFNRIGGRAAQGLRKALAVERIGS